MQIKTGIIKMIKLARDVVLEYEYLASLGIALRSPADNMQIGSPFKCCTDSDSTNSKFIYTQYLVRTEDSVLESRPSNEYGHKSSTNLNFMDIVDEIIGPTDKEHNVKKHIK